jgi:hypothetical protein
VLVVPRRSLLLVFLCGCHPCSDGPDEDEPCDTSSGDGEGESDASSSTVGPPGDASSAGSDSGDDDDAETGHTTDDDGEDSSSGSTGEGPVALGEPVEVPLALDFEPLALELGDFDGDGRPDALVSGSSAGLVGAVILFGLGDGTFGAPVPTEATGCSAYPAVGRLDGDDSTDVVMAACNGMIAVWRGAGGALVAWPQWGEESYPGMRTNVVTDFAGDGLGDLLTLRVVAGAPGEIRIDRSTAAGEIVHAVGTDLGATLPGFDPDGIASGFLDDDAVRDVVMMDREHSLARARGSAGAGGLVQAEPITGVEITPWSVFVAGMDGDALDDVVVTSHASAAVQVLVNAGDAGLVAGAVVPFSAVAPWDAAMSDVDGDGARDLVAVDASQASLEWMRGDGAGALATAQVRELSAPAIRVHLADLDGNGRDDVVAATFSAGTLTVILADGT